MIRSFLATAFLAFAAEASSATTQQHERDLWRSPRFVDLKITVTNIAYRQPMSPFFIAVHNEEFQPLYKLGYPAPMNGLQALAEDGDPSELVECYTSSQQSPYSRHVGTFADDEALNFGAPLLEGGESTSTIVRVSEEYRYVSLASMAVNTNDCFVGFSSIKLCPGQSFTIPGDDAGTEEKQRRLLQCARTRLCWH